VLGKEAVSPTPTHTHTPTPTHTPTHTPTPLPGAKEIQIDPACDESEGISEITITGYDWPDADVKIQHFLQGKLQQEWTLAADSFEINFTRTITIEATLNSEHTIKALYHLEGDKFKMGDAAVFTVPCPTPTPTPTFTPAPANLVVQSIALANEEPLSTYSPLTFTVSIANIGGVLTESWFWADLFVDPADPISPTNPALHETDYWAPVKALAGGESVVLALPLLYGVEVTGVHTCYVMADTLNEIGEGNELDNVGGPFTFTVDLEGTPPTPAPVPAAEGEGSGAISGVTWLQLDDGVAPQGMVNVYLYNGDALVAETTSDANGNYWLQDLAPGTYTVIGEVAIDGVLYTGTAMGIVVGGGETAPYVTLYLG
jgi:hypothetical protein